MSTGYWLFDVRFGEATRELQFNKLWEDMGGRFGFAVESEFMPELDVGELAKCTTNEDVPRRMLFVGTSLGPVVVYEKKGFKRDLGMNLSPGLQSTFLFRGHAELMRKPAHKIWNEVSFEEMELILGDPYDDENPTLNLGHIIANIQGAAVTDGPATLPSVEIQIVV